MDDLPPAIKITPNSSNLPDSPDEPLFEAKINNPFSKFFKWIKDFINKQSSITIKIPVFAVVSVAVALVGGGGVIGGAIVYFFPNNSPVLHRAVIYQGNLQKTEKGFFLTLPNSDLYTLKPKTSTSINYQNLQSGQVLVKGNLTPEKFVIEVSEIIPLGFSAPLSTPKESKPAFEVLPLDIPDQNLLPDLYPNLQWETTQKKVLIFTSGKRKIEQEGVYLESVLVSAFPQDFINYYIEALKLNDFKETLNAINPEGITVTYAKDNLFLTFGIKNIYKGSGDNKQLSGYKAFIEHN